jgi:hypothetical protein
MNKKGAYALAVFVIAILIFLIALTMLPSVKQTAVDLVGAATRVK